MSSLKFLIWKNREGAGEPEVEVTIPLYMAKWVPKLMRFVPRKTKQVTWGDDVDFDQMFTGFEEMVKEAEQSGHPEVMQVKARDGYVKVLVEK